MYDDLYHQTRNNAHRFTVKKADDSQSENYLDLEGLQGHKPTIVLHVQPHGFSSVPVEDAHLVGLPLGHNYDGLVALGGESPKHKPKNLGSGNSALYNADGTIWKLINKKATLDAGESVTVTTPKVTFKCGGVTVVIDGSGVTITGGKVTHNGKNIGSDHKHTEVVKGGDLTGVPQ